MEKFLTVFGSGLIKHEDNLYYEAFEIGKLLATKGFIACSGGYYGIMEAISKGVKSAGGKTIGITVKGWKNRPNKYIDEVVEMPNLMERLTELIAIGDAYLIFKGGTGTLVEISVALELMNKKIMKEKKLICYGTFWKKVVDLLKEDSLQLLELINRCVIYTNKNNFKKYLINLPL